MTTIPIEVIVQDVETPVEPTPTPETNIAVPDTGAGTIGNSTFSSSSIAGIIVPVVLLVLALATVCTLLIHRHHKRQDSEASKKEKLVASISTTIAVLSATVLIGNLIMPATKAATSDSEVSIEVPDKISIVVNREDDTTEATTEATAYVTSTSAFGYKVLLSMAEDQQYYLKDNRDDKTYRIAKLKDGNIWMTQNLDLQKEDLLEGVSINNNNTDNPIASFMLPDSQTSGDESWGDSDDEAAVNSLHIYDVAGSGETYYYCTDPQPWGCQAWGTDPIPVSEFGNYYNWHTATAGTGTYSLTSNEIASGSLCPSGWRLPNGGNYGVAIDLSNLLYEYGILQSRTSNDYDSSKLDDIYGPPLYLGRAGAYANGVTCAGAGGNVWYSMAEDTLKAQSMQYGSKLLYVWGNPHSSENKTRGYSVRCLAY